MSSRGVSGGTSAQRLSQEQLGANASSAPSALPGADQGPQGAPSRPSPENQRVPPTPALLPWVPGAGAGLGVSTSKAASCRNLRAPAAAHCPGRAAATSLWASGAAGGRAGTPPGKQPRTPTRCEGTQRHPKFGCSGHETQRRFAPRPVPCPQGWGRGTACHHRSYGKTCDSCSPNVTLIPALWSGCGGGGWPRRHGLGVGLGVFGGEGGGWRWE